MFPMESIFAILSQRNELHQFNVKCLTWDGRTKSAYFHRYDCSIEFLSVENHSRKHLRRHLIKVFTAFKTTKAN